jgi:hypothetical protein
VLLKQTRTLQPKRHASPMAETTWWRQVGQYVFVAWDFAAGVVIGLGIGLATVEVPKLATNGFTVMLAELALGVAVLAVVLTALSILVAFLGEEYVMFLKGSPLGIRGAIEPYRVISIVTGCQVFAALLAVVCWSLAPLWGQAVALGVVTGLATWSIVGTVQLVNLTARHGYLRSRMPEIREAARKALRDRQSA